MMKMSGSDRVPMFRCPVSLTGTMLKKGTEVAVNFQVQWPRPNIL